jgi:hypothetical protein
LAQAHVALHEPGNHASAEVSKAKRYGGAGGHDAHLHVFVGEGLLNDGVREARRQRAELASRANSLGDVGRAEPLLDPGGLLRIAEGSRPARLREARDSNRYR